MEHHCVHLVGWPGEESAENCTTSTEESVPSFLSEEEEATWIHRVFFFRALPLLGSTGVFFRAVHV